MRLLQTALVAFTLSLSVLAQTDFVKDNWIVPKFETELGRPSKFRVFVGMETSVLISEVSPGLIAVNGDAKWRDTGFPTLREYKINGIKQSKNKPSEVTLRNDASTPAGEMRKQVKLVIAPQLDLQKTLSELFFKGSISEFLKSDYFSATQDKYLSKMFSGSLASIPKDQQKKLHIWANLNNDAFGETAFKDRKYFLVTTRQDVAYNTIQVNQAERTSRQTEKSLKDLREIFSITGPVSGFDGIKLFTIIASHDFVQKDDYKYERFEMYVSFELLKKFVEADITNQELIDGSTILMDGSRMKVNVTSFS